jgi:hypothetical protein
MFAYLYVQGGALDAVLLLQAAQKVRHCAAFCHAGRQGGPLQRAQVHFYHHADPCAAEACSAEPGGTRHSTAYTTDHDAYREAVAERH